MCYVQHIRVMQSTRQNLSLLIRTVAAHTNRAASTLSRLVTGSGDTLRRIEALHADGTPVHRISTDRVENAVLMLSDIWPADLEWPADIPRPSKSKAKEKAA